MSDLTEASLLFMNFRQKVDYDSDASVDGTLQSATTAP